MRLVVTSLISLWLSSWSLMAQESPSLKLEHQDPAVVEDACRRLITGVREQLSEVKLTRLLDHEREVVRFAAARVLLHHGLGRMQLQAVLTRGPKALADGSTDTWNEAVGLRAMLVPVGTEEQLAQLTASGQILEVRIAALRELENRGLLADSLVLRLLADSDDAIGEEMARVLTEERAPFPVALARRAEGVDFGVSRLLTALAGRPRSEALIWIGELFEADELPPHERLLAFAGLGYGGASLQQAREILDAALDPELRSVALHAADQLSAKVADMLIPELHRRCLEGKPASDILDCLDRISLEGERHLLALARALPEDPREKIADWLTVRSSRAVVDLVEEALNGSFRLEPYLIRRSMPFMEVARHLATVVAFLSHEGTDEAVAAFSALVDAGVYDPRMLDYAVADERQRAARLRRLLELPFHVLPAKLFVQLLEDDDLAVVRVALGALLPGPMVHDLEPQLVRLAQDVETSIGLLAAQKLFSAGRSKVVEELFVAMEKTARERVLTALRERKEPWVLALLERDDSIASQYTRFHLGDASVLDAMIADPVQWPVRWLRRCDELAAKHLSPKHLSALERILVLQPVEVERRALITSWLALRTDLAAGALLTQIHETDAEEEVRYEALRGLLVRAEGIAIRSRLQKKFSTGLSDRDKDLAYEVVGAMSSPLGTEETEFLAELLLMVPLADPIVECGLHRANSDLVRTPDLPLLNMFWQLMRRKFEAPSRARFLTVAASTAQHPNRHALGRRRLGGLLILFARDSELRAPIAPAIARLIVASPDFATEFLGPAYLILAEQAAAQSDWSGAASSQSLAVRYFLRTPPRPVVVRALLGDNLQGDGQLPNAMLTAQHEEYRARARLALGDKTTAKQALARARSLAFGDREAMAALEALQQEIDR